MMSEVPKMNKADILFDNSRFRIMGILNVTPDSFYDGGYNFLFQEAMNRIAIMVKVGADAIDIGGESTRPGSDPVELNEELNRVLPVIEAASKRFDVCLSIDTQKYEVAREAIKAGAHVINSVDGLRDARMADLAAETNTPTIIMHMHGEPKTMHLSSMEGNVIEELSRFFDERIEMCKGAGIKKFILDPGIGFGKSAEQNLTIVKHLGKLKKKGIPLLIGHSNKSFIGKVTGREVDARTFGTNAVTALAFYNGADIVRVHEVASARDAANIAYAVKTEKIKPGA
jgi:dihydropteroate synthase